VWVWVGVFFFDDPFSVAPRLLVFPFFRAFLSTQSSPCPAFHVSCALVFAFFSSPSPNSSPHARSSLSQSLLWYVPPETLYRRRLLGRRRIPLMILFAWFLPFGVKQLVSDQKPVRPPVSPTDYIPLTATETFIPIPAFSLIPKRALFDIFAAPTRFPLSFEPKSRIGLPFSPTSQRPPCCRSRHGL